MGLRAEFEQYRAIEKEAEDILEKMETMGCVTDIVTASSSEYPFTKHKVTISGRNAVEETKLLQELREKKRKLLKVRQEIEKAPNRIIRMILTKRYVVGMEWEKVAKYVPGRNGEDATGDSVRKRAERYLDGLGK